MYDRALKLIRQYHRLSQAELADALKPPSRTSIMIRVTKLKCPGGYRLHATFSDGTAGEHDFSALVAESGPMIEPLRDPAYFARVFLEDGAPTWPNDFDMDPEWLRREIEATSGLTRIPLPDPGRKFDRVNRTSELEESARTGLELSTR